MATVPEVLIVGDEMTQGGNQPDSDFGSLGEFDTSEFQNMDLHRVTPDDGTTGAPTAASVNWYPWFDGALGDLHTIASATATTVTVTGAGWTINEWAGFSLTTNNLTGFGMRNTNIVVISNTADTITVAGWTSTPEVGTFVWMDEGRWSDYAMHRAWRSFTEVLAATVQTRGGSSWQQGGQGIGYDAGLIPELWKNTWPNTPYFQLAKHAHVSPMTGQWNTGGSSARLNFEAARARQAAAWTLLANGHTREVQHIIWDSPGTELLDWVATPLNFLNYEAGLTTVAAYFRGLSGISSTATFYMVNHDARMRAVSAPAGVGLMNRAHRAMAASDANARVISLDGLGLPLRGTSASFIPSEDRPYYASSAMLVDIPKKIRRSIELVIVGAAAAYDGAIPVYIMIGDSITVGTGNAAYLAALGSPTQIAGARNARQGIYNRGSGVSEPYDANDNSNTSGSVTANHGPESAALVELEALHPVTGCILIKRGSSASTLIVDGVAYSAGAAGRWSKSYAATEHYDELGSDIEGCFQYINNTLGKQADLKGVIVGLGTNDASFAGGGALFAAELPTFVADLRTDFSTRSSGADVPFAWRIPQTAAAGAIAVEVAAIRAALTALDAADDRFTAYNVDDLERDATDDLHETPESNTLNGQRAVAALAAIAI